MGFFSEQSEESEAGRFASPVIPCVWEAKITGQSLGGHYVVTTACWEVASPVIPGVWEAKSHISECLPGHSPRCFSGEKQKALPNLPVHWAGRVATRNINCSADF